MSAMTGRAAGPFAVDATQPPQSRLIANPREQHHEVTRLFSLTYMRVKSCARLTPSVRERVRAEHPVTIRQYPTWGGARPGSLQPACLGGGPGRADHAA